MSTSGCRCVLQKAQSEGLAEAGEGLWWPGDWHGPVGTNAKGVVWEGCVSYPAHTAP